MKMKVWKKCMFIIGVPLLVITSLCANNKIPDNSVKKTRSGTFIYEKDKAWVTTGN